MTGNSTSNCSKLIGIFAITAGLGILSSSARVSADEALDLYKRGVALFNLDKYEEAAGAFRRAYEIKPSWKLFFNIGQAEAAARHYGLALDALESYLVEGGDDVPETRRASVIKDIQSFKLLVGRLVVDAPDGTEVFIDGRSRGVTPLKGIIRVAAGTHRVTLERDGEQLLEREIKLAGEVETRLAADNPGPPAPPANGGSADDPTQSPSTAAEEDKSMSKKAIAGVAVGGTGIATLGAGVALFVLGRNSFDKADGSTDRDYYNTWHDKYKWQNVSGIALMGTGGALLSAGVILLVAGLNEDNSAAGSDIVSITPIPGGAAVSF